MDAVLSPLTGWLLFAALVGSTGAAVGHWWLIRHAGSTWDGTTRSALSERAAGLGLTSAIGVTLALGLYFWRQLREFRDPFVPWTEDAGVLLSTRWGQTWIVAVLVSLVAVAGFRAARAGRIGGWIAATGATLMLGFFPGLTGHAAATEGLTSLAVAADALHVWGAGGWVGGLGLILYLEAGWRRADPTKTSSLLPALVPVFSPLAMVCVAALATTGVFAAWAHLPSIGALVSTGYGRLLILKLVLVGLVLGLGALNWKKLTPRLHEAGGTDTLRRAAAMELLAAQLVLLVTALLVRTSPMDP